MNTMDDEKEVLNRYRLISSRKIVYVGRFFHCLRVERLTKSFLFSKSWIDSSSNGDLPPDFHNNKHKIMMDIMRIDDCVEKKKGRRVLNSFARTNLFMEKYFGKNYKEEHNGTLFFVPDTSNRDDFNYNGYIKNFKRVLDDHSNKVDNYRKNYPQCKACVLFICDESNNYIQLTEKTVIKDGELSGPIKVHNQFLDKRFLDVIRNTKADYVIWFGYYKLLFINSREVKQPLVCIYDVKHMNKKEIEYDSQKMFMLTEEMRR